VRRLLPATRWALLRASDGPARVPPRGWLLFKQKKKKSRAFPGAREPALPAHNRPGLAPAVIPLGFLPEKNIGVQGPPRGVGGRSEVHLAALTVARIVRPGDALIGASPAARAPMRGPSSRAASHGCPEPKRHARVGDRSGKIAPSVLRVALPIGFGSEASVGTKPASLLTRNETRSKPRGDHGQLLQHANAGQVSPVDWPRSAIALTHRRKCPARATAAANRLGLPHPIRPP